MKITRKTLKKLVGSNFSIQITALLTAIVTWYLVQSATRNETIITDVPVSVQLQPGWGILHQSAKTVDIAFRGTRDDLRYLNRDMVKVTVDARHITQRGVSLLQIRPQDVSAPGGARVAFLRPSSFTVHVDREEKQQYPVRVETHNLLPDGYEIERIVVTPATVEVEGAAQLLEEISHIKTEPIDLDGRTHSINKRRLTLVTDDSQGRIRVEPSVVTVDMTIVERTQTVTFEAVAVHPLLATGAATALTIQPESASVSLVGPPGIMKSLKPERVRLFVDASNPAFSGGELSIQAVLPRGVRMDEVRPPVVKVKVAK